MKTTLTRILFTTAICVAASSINGAQQMPRDPRPTDVRPATEREIELQKSIAVSPRNVNAMLELAKLQQDRGATSDAHATLIQARDVDPSNMASHLALAMLFLRSGEFSRAMETLEAAAALRPADPAVQHLIGTFYFEKTRDQTLASEDKLAYIQRGIAAEDRALELNADYMEAMVYKNLLLRVQATLEPDAAKQQALILQADALRARAVQLQKTMPAAAPAGGGAMAPPPPPHHHHRPPRQKREDSSNPEPVRPRTRRTGPPSRWMATASTRQALRRIGWRPLRRGRLCAVLDGDRFVRQALRTMGKWSRASALTSHRETEARRDRPRPWSCSHASVCRHRPYGFHSRS